MLEIFKRSEAAPVAAAEPVPRFSQGDIAFTKRDTEKVNILGLAKKRETVSETYVNFGIEYIIRGADNRSRPIYEFELMDLDEACDKVESK